MFLGCASFAKLDIIFGIDNSVSNQDSFELLKQLTTHITLQNLAKDTKLGFTLYDHCAVTISAPLQYWTRKELRNHINSMIANIVYVMYDAPNFQIIPHVFVFVYSNNTRNDLGNEIGGLILNALKQFSDTFNFGRQ